MGERHTCATYSDGDNCWGADDDAESNHVKLSQITTPGPSMQRRRITFGNKERSKNGRNIALTDEDTILFVGAMIGTTSVCWGQNHKDLRRTCPPWNCTQRQLMPKKSCLALMNTMCDADRRCLDWNPWSLPSTRLYLDDEVCGDGNDNDLDGDADEGCGPDGDPDNDQILTVVDNCPVDWNPNQLDPQQRRYWRCLSTSR